MTAKRASVIALSARSLPPQPLEPLEHTIPRCGPAKRPRTLRLTARNIVKLGAPNTREDRRARSPSDVCAQVPVPDARGLPSSSTWPPARRKGAATVKHDRAKKAAPCQTTTTKLPPKKRKDSDKPVDTSEIYLKQIRSFALLTKDDEVSLARRLEEVETAAWLLWLTTNATAVITCVEQVFAELPAKNEKRVKLPSFENDTTVVAAAMRKLDPYHVYSSAVAAAISLDNEALGQLRALQHEAAIVRERFITSNLRLVISMAKTWTASGASLADLIQEGNLGLMTAVQQFDHRKGFRFSTYATWWIRHALSRFIANKHRVVRIPVHLQESSSKINKHRATLTVALGREPTLEELSEAAQLPKAKLDALTDVRAAMYGATSLDAPIHTNVDGPSLGDHLVDPRSSSVDTLIADESRRRVITALATLSEREAEVIKQCFGIDRADHVDDELTLGAIGATWGISRERVRQIKNEALGKLRFQLERGELAHAARPGQDGPPSSTDCGASRPRADRGR